MKSDFESKNKENNAKHAIAARTVKHETNGVARDNTSGNRNTGASLSVSFGSSNLSSKSTTSEPLTALKDLSKFVFRLFK